MARGAVGSSADRTSDHLARLMDVQEIYRRIRGGQPPDIVEPVDDQRQLALVQTGRFLPRSGDDSKAIDRLSRHGIDRAFPHTTKAERAPVLETGEVGLCPPWNCGRSPFVKA